MKILHIVPTYFPAVRYGGPIYAIHQLCMATVKLGHEVDVFTTNRDGCGVLDLPLGIPVPRNKVQIYYFQCFGLLRFWYFSPKMKEALSEKISEYDFVHIHSVFLWPTLIASMMARKKKISYCISPRGSLVSSLIKRKSLVRKFFYINLIEKINLHYAKFIHATSDLEAEELRLLNLPINNIEVVPNGVDLNIFSFQQTVGVADYPTPYLLYLGRISWKKRIDLLIKAMPAIDAKVHLVIAGNDEEGERSLLDKLIRDLNLDTRIHFSGFIGGAEKTKLIQNSLMLVLPSENENFGNVVLESWACKRPVAVVKNVGLSSFVEQHKAGILISPSPQLIAKELNGIINNNKLLNEFGENGYRLASANFKWLDVAQRLCELYKKYSVNFQVD